MCGPRGAEEGAAYGPPGEGRIPHGAWIRVCLPGVFLTYRMDDDFSHILWEKWQSSPQAKKRQCGNPNISCRKISAACTLQACF